MIDIESLINAKEQERVEFLIKQHWIIPSQLIFLFFVAIAVPVGGWLFLAFFMPGLFASQLFQALWVLGLSTYSLMALLFFFQTFLDYHLDIYIVTNQRIISAERKSLFRYVTSELRLYQIQDVTAETNGFFANLMNFGTVTVQTAGEMQEFDFESIPNPREVARRILELVDADRKLHKEKIVEAVEGKEI